ncbi:MAG: hypothetical protein P1V97_00490, partial [Planctomycetota bacterium]|nr:hypothetical protein [Planctomycetota bacterium]
MKKNLSYALLTAFLILGAIFCAQFFNNEQLTSSSDSSLHKNSFLPKDFSPIPLDTTETKQAESKGKSKPIPKGHWIEITDDSNKSIPGYSLIVSTDSKALTGSLNDMNMSRLFLSERFPESWVFTIYAKGHIPFVSTVADLRQRKQIQLFRSPSIEGIVLFKKTPVNNGIATLTYNSREHELTARRLAVAGLISKDSYLFHQSPLKSQVTLGRFTFPQLKVFGKYKIE